MFSIAYGGKCLGERTANLVYTLGFAFLFWYLGHVSWRFQSELESDPGFLFQKVGQIATHEAAGMDSASGQVPDLADADEKMLGDSTFGAECYIEQYFGGINYVDMWASVNRICVMSRLWKDAQNFPGRPPLDVCF